MCIDLNHLTHSQVNINPSNPPFKLYLRIPHTPPYHLGLDPKFTGELPGVCMPYQVLQPYFIYMQSIYAPLIIFFMCHTVATPSPHVVLINFTSMPSSHISILIFPFSFSFTVPFSMCVSYHVHPCTKFPFFLKSI